MASSSASSFKTPAVPPNRVGFRGVVNTTCRSISVLQTPSSVTSTTLGSRNNEGILAIFQGRGGQGLSQIGLACIPIPVSTIVLCEFTDSASYQKTLSKIEVFDPRDIIMSTTSCDSANRLFGLVQQQFPGIRIIPVERRYFSENQGLDMLREVVNSLFSPILVEVSAKVVALAAASAILHYLNVSCNVKFDAKSLRLEFKAPEKTMLIDCVTSKHLELVTNNHTMGQKDTLFGLFSKDCRTPIGARLLRSSILEPLCNEEVIEQRMDCVEELKLDGELLYKIQAALTKLPVDIDQMIYGLVQQPNFENSKLFQHRVNLLISLKHTLETIPMFLDALESAENAYFRKLYEVFKNASSSKMLGTISEVINEDAEFHRSAAKMKLQRAYAIKSEINRILDVARKVYQEIMFETHEYVLSLSREHGLALEFVDSPVKGFHLRLRLRGRNTMDNLVLPNVFIRSHINRSTVTFTTEALLIADRRAREVATEIDNISWTIVAQLIQNIKEELPSLYSVSEAVGQLDVLQCLAFYASTVDCIRPSFSSICTAIEEGRHPILTKVLKKPTVSNNTFLTPLTNVKVITGPNMSGKSTYLKQVALLQILAQIGSFVPAVSATFRVADAIYTRIGSEDCLEENASSFAVEMAETSFILENATGSSLILIDELGRSTSHEEGTAIAWAVLETLQESSAFILFATHFLFLTKMEATCYNVLNYQMVTNATQNAGQDQKKLKYTHILKRGVTDIELYGLYVAKTSAIPESIVLRSYEIAHTIQAQHQESRRSKTRPVDTKKYLRGVVEYLKVQEPLIADNQVLLHFLTDIDADRTEVEEQRNGRSSTNSVQTNSTARDNTIDGSLTNRNHYHGNTGSDIETAPTAFVLSQRKESNRTRVSSTESIQSVSVPNLFSDSSHQAHNSSFSASTRRDHFHDSLNLSPHSAGGSAMSLCSNLHSIPGRSSGGSRSHGLWDELVTGGFNQQFAADTSICTNKPGSSLAKNGSAMLRGFEFDRLSFSGSGGSSQRNEASGYNSTLSRSTRTAQLPNFFNQTRKQQTEERESVLPIADWLRNETDSSFCSDDQVQNPLAKTLGSDSFGASFHWNQLHKPIATSTETVDSSTSRLETSSSMNPSDNEKQSQPVSLSDSPKSSTSESLKSIEATNESKGSLRIVTSEEELGRHSSSQNSFKNPDGSNPSDDDIENFPDLSHFTQNSNFVQDSMNTSSASKDFDYALFTFITKSQ